MGCRVWCKSWLGQHLVTGVQMDGWMGLLCVSELCFKPTAVD